MYSYSYFLTLVDDAKKTENKAIWIAEYGYPADCPYSGENLLKILGVIFDAAHGDIKNIVKNNGDAMAVSQKIVVPYRTVQNWVFAKTTPNEGIINLVAYALVGDIPEEKE